MKHFLPIFLVVFFPGLLFAQVKNSTATEMAKPFVLGEVVGLQSTQLEEYRTLNVYLPEGYNKDDTTKYPVVYLLDGSADEDFIHIVGLYQFNSFEWINRVPKSIIVGIAGVDRRRDFTFPTTIEEDKKHYPTTGHSDKFISFIEKELQPYIEHRYRTTASKTIIGESLGGLLAAEILLKKPKLFNDYIIVSPSFWWDNGSLLDQTTAPLKDRSLPAMRVYIGVEKEGPTPTKIPRGMKMDANRFAAKLKAAASKNIDVHFDYLPDETHATIMHQAVFNAIKILYPLKSDHH